MEYLTSGEIRELLGGISRSTLTYHRRKPDFPKPVITKGTIELWDSNEILEWINKYKAGKIKVKVSAKFENYTIEANIEEVYLSSKQVKEFTNIMKTNIKGVNIWKILSGRDKNKVLKRISDRGEVYVYVDKDDLIKEIRKANK